jgi:siroheme synthase-like protein
VTIISPTLTGELAGQVEADRIRWVKQRFREDHLDGAFLVIAATNDQDLNEAIVSRAGERGALVCDASSADRSQVIFAACLETDDVTVAVFTDGRDPALARRTRDRIAAFLADQDRRPSRS